MACPRPCLLTLPSRPSLSRSLLALLVAWFFAALAAAEPARPLRVTAALSAEGAGAGFPADAAPRRVALPDDWARTRPGEHGPVWYRVDFDASDARDGGDLAALYVAHACADLTVYLNGALVHGSARLSTPQVRRCSEPRLVPLPAALIRPGENRLELRVAGHPLAEVGSRTRAGGLSALEIGPQSLLAGRFARQTAIDVTLPQAVSATLLLMGGFMFVLGFINRRESHLAYFGALSVGWAIIDTQLWLRALPISNAAAEFLQCSMFAFVTMAGVQFLLRYANGRHRWVDRALPLQCALMPLSLALAGPARLHATASVWYVLLSLQAAAAAAYYLRRQWHARSASFWLMAAMLSALALTGAIELVAQLRGTQALAAQLAQLAQLAAPVMFVVVGLRLVQQHGRALQEAELGRAHLEQRVRDATAEIERNFRQLSELRVEQVTERERKRIAADLHDDLGAKLLTIVHTSDSERISTLAREALEEMRLSVRGLSGKAVRLADALGDWRAEVVNRLAQAGIGADWSAPEDLPQMLSARAYVQTTRILREATSNIIKHSGASNCSITLPRRRGRLPVRRAGQRRGHPARARWPARPRPRHGQHEAPRQATAGTVPRRVGTGLRNRDTPHGSAGSRDRAARLGAIAAASMGVRGLQAPVPSLPP